MENLGLVVAESLESLCKHDGKSASELQGFLSKQIWTPTDRAGLLSVLSQLLLHPTSTGHVTRAFRAIILDLLCRVRKSVQELRDVEEGHVRHQHLCVALSKIILITPEVKGWTLSYLTTTEPFYRPVSSLGHGEPTQKKSKKTRCPTPPSEPELLRATYILVDHLQGELRSAWDWADFMKLVNSPDITARWYTVNTIARLLSMSPACLQSFRKHHFTQTEIQQLSISCDSSLQESHERAMLLGNPSQCFSGCYGDRQSHTMRQITDEDLSDDVTCVCGVVLPRLSTTEQEQTHEELVMVPSTRRNLHCVALGVAAGSAVLLEGPVGCGKTALVEHIARVTGRGTTPLLMKIQLGDQTDSKALVGTYRCTDVPGEFVWQPGVLTTAVREGYWVLMEDLDYAPMDVVSLLLPLLETRTLSVPGHGDQVRAHPHFRIFATLRLVSSGGSLYRQQNTGMNILDKLWTRITVEPLSRAELQQVICHKYSTLATVVDKLLDIYFLLTSGKHSVSDSAGGSPGENGGDAGKFYSVDGRLISTRDLMKWCRRIAVDFDISQISTANAVHQEAIDCFCACIAKTDKLFPLVEAIGAKLNITKAKSEYYCSIHKPNVELTASRFTVGRACLKRKISETASLKRLTGGSFAFTRQAVNLLERVTVCVRNNEPVLLVGETGTGKTSSVQYLAEQLGHRLRVINMNQQSDSTDLLGGFKPVDIRFVVAPFREDFELTFCMTFSRKQNAKFLGHVQECFSKRRWHDLFKLMQHTTKSALVKTEKDAELHGKWQAIHSRLRQLKAQVKQSQSALAFSFIEGTLVRALKAGDWVLLDEINLATAETLECLSGLLESSSGSIVLMERGDTKPIIRHPEFRLFACMNPATDVGKKDLPPGVRNRFTELYMAELEDPPDLKILVAEYLKGLSLTPVQVDGIVKFYLAIKTEASRKLVDGTGHKPCYSLRTLCRALQHAAGNPCHNVPRSLFEGFCLSFLTQLDRASHPVVQQLICKHILSRQTSKALLKQALPQPTGYNSLKFEGFWVAVGTKEPETPEHYVLTPSVRANLRDLARVVSAGRHPVLLQGETSVGKTSLITYLSQASGNMCTRINNHEHTDIQEYVGCYCADETGKLVFKEGVLVEAMRKGFWIILDELNLAPSDVLEALNRLLDDNRELFIAETQETVKAHPRFMLFATQNPPGQYGGRKILSRAFRNRFVELHFSELPSTEVETILEQRCTLPRSYSKKLVAVMVDLQTRRRGSGVFTGKQGFITLRDLFRWADRYRQASYAATETFFDWDQQLADNGYLLLAGRCRHDDECEVIRGVLEKHIKRKVDPNNLFSLHSNTSPTTQPLLEALLVAPPAEFKHVVWTYSMRRMAVLTGQCLKFGEPVLLVGVTGCGKTTICQLFAWQREQKLYGVNCHMHTEGADFLGGLRPVRHHVDQDSSEDQKLFAWYDGPLVQAMTSGSMFLIDEISLADDSVLERLNSVLEPERTLLLAEKGGGDGAGNEIDVIVAKETFRIVATMNPGGDYGKKELSPALRNRFTEIWCPLSGDRDDMVAIMEHNLNQQVKLGDARPSGIANAIMDFIEWFSNNDFGKRCTVSIRDILSWVNFINALTSEDSMSTTETDMIDTETAMVATETDMETDVAAMDTKDIAVEFGAKTSSATRLSPDMAYIHGACMVFLDALGSGLTSGLDSNRPLAARQTCLQYLVKQLSQLVHRSYTLHDLGLDGGGEQQVEDLADPGSGAHLTEQLDKYFGISPFYIPRGPQLYAGSDNYALTAPTTCTNAQRLLRSLQLSRPLLLEGSPGVGKTSLVSAVARAAGHDLVRINLSEQTDVSDLFGADLPVEGGEGGQFAWRDGPLLQALKAGAWVVLDELNLASQSVLEGLNACLDHRGEIYVPELGRTFHIQRDKTRLFACQNPLHQGGGRKGLPRSFLNRFTQVYIEPLTRADLLFITGAIYPQIPGDTLAQMVDFNQKVYKETMLESVWGQRGGPWEFNLRDIFRWCDLLHKNQMPARYDPGEYMSLVYTDRMRTAADKSRMNALYEDIFTTKPYTPTGQVAITTSLIQVGHSFLPRKNTVDAAGVIGHLSMLHHILPPLESLMKCIKMQYMTILVGPSGVGKTSMVQLLAQLCGHQLHVLPMNSSMDTTELLGGFEQMDLNRHLEGVERSTDLLLHTMIAQMLATRRQHHTRVQKLLQLWHNYLASRNQEATLLVREELDRLRHQLVALEDIVTTMVKTSTRLHLPQQAEVEGLRPRLERLSGLVERCERTRHGGTFEWIDSVLVQALTNGDWLLIDNVNFCSASVLDRLNALLEPGGVLSINERGVIDGQIPSITPHPAFRLVLALDPKHGEISRAMRNRGVEINILGEDEGGNYDDHDIKTMLHGLGLVGQLPVATLMDLHQSVKSETFGAGRLHVTDLLRTGQLVVQQLERGLDLHTALYNSAIEVYVRPQREPHTKQALSAIINERLSSLDLVESETNTETSSLLELGLWPDRLPAVTAWCHDVTMATIQQQTALFLHILNETVQETSTRTKFPLSMTQVTSPGHALSSSESKTAILYLKPALKLMVENVSVRDWKMLSHWLTSVIKQRVIKSTKAGKTCDTVLGSISDVIPKSLSTMFDSSLMNQVNETLKGVCSQDYESCEQITFDLRWNKAFLEMMSRSPESRGSSLDDLQYHNLSNLCNQLYLLCQLSQDSMYHVQGLSGMEKAPKRHDASVLQLSYAAHTNLLKVGQLPDPCLAQLYPFISQLDSHLLQLFSEPRQLDDDQWLKSKQALVQYDWFVQFCRQPIRSQTMELLLPTLSLHWNWLWDALVSDLHLNNRLSAKLVPIVNKLQVALGSDSSVSHLHQMLSQSLGQPKPFPSASAAELLLRAGALSRDMCVGDVQLSQPDKVRAKLGLCQRDGGRLKIRLVQVVHKIWTEDLHLIQDWANAELKAIESTLRELNLLSHVHNMEIDQSPEGASVLPVSETTVALMPVYDHMAVAMEMDLLGAALGLGASFSEQEVEKWMDFVVEKSSLNAGDLALWCGVKNQMDDGGTLAQLVRHFLGVLANSTATQMSKYWLSWKQHESVSMDVGEYSQRDINGPALMHTANLSHHAFCLLTEQSALSGVQEQKLRRAKKEQQTWLPSNIAVGKTSEKLGQLKKMSAYLLLSTSSMAADTHSFSSKSLALVQKILQNLLAAIVSVLPNTHQMSLESLFHSPDGTTNITDLISAISKVELQAGKLKILLPEIDSILQDLLKCFTEILQADLPSSHLRELFATGRCWATVGMFQGFLLAPRGPVDPAYKLAVEMDYTQQQIGDMNRELELRDRQHQLLTGQNYSPEGSTHPAVRHLLIENQRLNEWMDQYSHQVATRPQPPQFHLLLADVRQFQGTIGSADRLGQLLADLQQAYDSASNRGKPESRAVMREYRIWLRNVEQYTKRLEGQYAFYRDLILPYVTAIKQVHYGVSLMGHAVEGSYKINQLALSEKQSQSPVESVIQTLCQFPYTSDSLPSALSVAQRLIDDTTRWQLEQILSKEVEGTGSQPFIRRLLTCGLQHLRNHLAVTLTLDDAAIYYLSRLFNQYVTVWFRAEELRRLRDEKSASLYRYKDEIHGDSLTQEQHDQKDMEQRFPTFDEEFDDITVGFTLDDSKKKKKPTNKTQNASDDHNEGDDLDFDLEAVNLSPEEMSNVCRLHQMAFTKLTNTFWHQGSLGKLEDELSYAEPVANGYQVAAEVGKELSMYLDPRMDGRLLGSHLVVSKVLQDAVSEDCTRWKKVRRPYDVYHDTNVKETVKCRPVLERFAIGVNVLLVEWPDHPTLKQLLQIVKRLLSFDVTSPVMRFVTGLEILLQKSHEWETNAARHVSLSEQMLAVTTQIIEWRKLELTCWQSCLDTVHWHIQEKASKWWFNLYQLLQAFIQPTTEDQTPKPEDKGADSSVADMKSLISTLQQFMEGSSLGEYTTRLDMIQAFHYQLVQMDPSSRQEEIMCLLWNLHQHYKQFVPNIQGEISRLRSPIERQLKGFVKIARWNDINYYAVKQTVERTHKTLHKHMKAFETILGQPVVSLLTEDVKLDWSAGSQNEAEGGATRVLDVAVFVDNTPVSLPECPEALHSELLQRLPHLTRRFVKHCRNVMSSSRYSQYSMVLDQFTGELIESVHELQALDISKIEDKDRQKSEVKHIHLRKRKALADLFKYLHTIGLSHRKGLNSISRGSMESNAWLTGQPLDVTTALKQLHKLRCDEETSVRWSGCDTYYRRCISRRVLLHTALRTPVQELGVGNIERCKGFSEHLTQLILTQRFQLTDVFNSYTALREELGSLTQLADHSVSPQAASRQWMVSLKSLCDQSLDGLNQVVLVLKCCPSHSTDGSTSASLSVDGSSSLVSPFTTRHQCKVMLDEQELMSTTTKLQENIAVISEIKLEVDRIVKNSHLLTSCTVDLLAAFFTKLQQVSENISQMLVDFTFPINNQLHPLATTLVFIQSQIWKAAKEFSDWLADVQSWHSGDLDEDLSVFSADVDSFVKEMLLVVQKFVKDHKGSEELGQTEVKGQEAEEDTDIAEKDEVDVDLVDGHISNVLYQGLEDKFQDLKVNKVLSCVRALTSKLTTWSNERHTFSASNAASKLLSHCMLLLRQYCSFVQSVITEGLSAHRAMTKLLSVLLSVFTELVQKGFCLPEEYSDELAGEGTTDFKDIEGGGLGEGEGVKDVSDQIETEDQLEDVHRQGEEAPEPEDHSEEPEIKDEDNAIEMSEAFDGKTHDMDKEEGSEASDDDNDKEEDLDKEMGDLEGGDADKLDEQVWGSDDEDEQNQDNEDESGPGAGQQTETELVAKDDNEDKTDGTDDKDKEKKEEQTEETREQLGIDETEYNDDEVDPHYDDQSQQEEAEPMDLPDDLKLDDQEAGLNDEEDGETDQQNENPDDIDKLMEDAPESTEAEQEEKAEQKSGEGEAEEEQGDDGKEQSQEEQGKEGEEEQGKEEEEEQTGSDQGEAMDTEEQAMEVEQPNEQQGAEPKDDNQEELAPEVKDEPPPEGTPETAQHSGKTSHDSAEAEQSETADATAGENEQDQQNEGMGLAETDQDKGHEGQDSTSVTKGSSQQDQSKASERRPGQSSEDRSTGSTEDKVHRRLHTVDTEQSKPQPQGSEPQKSDLYEHIKESEGHYDTQTLDVAGVEDQQAVPNMSDDEAEPMDEEQEVQPDDNQKVKEEEESDVLSSAELKKASSKPGEDGKMEGQIEIDEDAKAMIDGENVQTHTVARGLESSIHAEMDLYHSYEPNDVDLERLRSELEEGLSQLTVCKPGDLQEEREAQEAWSRYETLTSSLSQELCEQLRLVLEPTQASKLRGDFRTGKRLNMRKVIPYIASQFRKDKIWLRRTKPSKRQYQVMLAIDDSSSMDDNHSKQLAFESMSVIANALTLLEVGELSICSFGESVKLLHSFQDQFSSQSGARILQQFTFEQKKTKIAELLNHMTSTMMTARTRQRGLQTEISQLLLVVSDGRGLFMEGMEVVKSAVRRAREANVFLVFVIIDNPDNKDSILDIRVPVFKSPGQLPEIKSYMDSFPFPFYIILRDINSLPHTLSDALRQWFELVTAHDR